VVVVLASVSAWFTLLSPTQRRPLPNSKTLPPLPSLRPSLYSSMLAGWITEKGINTGP
jgi:hypothetical protein